MQADLASAVRLVQGRIMDVPLARDLACQQEQGQDSQAHGVDPEGLRHPDRFTLNEASSQRGRKQKACESWDIVQWASASKWIGSQMEPVNSGQRNYEIFLNGAEYLGYTLAAGLFFQGDLFNPKRIIFQLFGILAAFLWAFPLVLLMYLIIDKTVGLRASTQDEQRGLDYSEHFELDYPEFQRELLHAGKE